MLSNGRGNDAIPAERFFDAWNREQIMELVTTSNFDFLAEDSPQMFQLATDAEARFRAGDTVGCVTALRTFGEVATKILLDGHSTGLDEDGRSSQRRRIEELYSRNQISNFAYNGLQVLRSVGNEAVHEWSVSKEDADRCLKRAWEVALVERRVFAPRARLSLKTIGEYVSPEFGETQATVRILASENEELKHQLEEVEKLLESRAANDSAHSDRPDTEDPVQTLSSEHVVRLEWIEQLC